MKITIIKTIIVFLLIFFTLEISARTHDYLKWGAGFFSVYSAEILKYEDEYGRRNRPNYSFEKWHINKYGFRGADFSISKREDEKRIVFLGASETFGMYESPDMEYVSQFRRLLTNSKPEWTVINAASPGLKIPQMTKLYRNFIQKFKPDIVVIYPSPVFYLDFDPPTQRASSNKILFDTKSFELRIGHKLKLKIKSILNSRFQSFLRECKIKYDLSRTPNLEVWRAPPQKRLDMFENDLVLLVGAIRDSGATPVLMTHANRFSSFGTLSLVEKYDLISWRRFFPRATGRCLLDFESTSNQIIKQLGTRLRIHTIDTASMISGNQNYFADFAHFNDLGAEKLSRAIYYRFLKLDVVLSNN